MQNESSQEKKYLLMDENTAHFSEGWKTALLG